MESNTNETLWHQQYYYRICALKLGAHRIVHERNSRILFLLVTTLSFCSFYWMLQANSTLFRIIGGNPKVVLLLVALPTLACCVLLVYLLGHLPHGKQLYQDFIRTGFVNGSGEPPFLIGYHQDEKEIVQLTFAGVGFPRENWQKNQTTLETALNRYIAQIVEGNDRRSCCVTAVPPAFRWQTVEWRNDFIDPEQDHILLLGQGLLGQIKVNVEKQPHILIGGSTGSGKSVLLKTLLWQALNSNSEVLIADFKGGVDYSAEWHTKAEIITEETILLQRLEQLAAELEHRKELFRQSQTPNLSAYRAKTGTTLPRVFVACDEVAELLDKTGADKERKELLAKIEAQLSLIARQGRAFGIHLILATQRPDANILPGQIKNNLDVRICGKADATLSTIILGDGIASEMIPKDSQGRFVMEDGTVFQGYWLKN